MDINVHIKAGPELAEAIITLASALAIGRGSQNPDLQKEVPTPPAAEPAPVVTLEEVRAKLAALSQNGKQAEVKKLIGKFGAKKLTEIPEEKFSELLEEAEAI